MKKIIGVAVVSAVVSSIIFVGVALADCSAMPQTVRDNWSTLSEAEKQSYTESYCTGTTGVGASTGVGAPTNINVTIQNPIKANTFSDFVSDILAAAVKVLMPFVVIGFMISGFLFIKAQGNAEELKKAKTAIMYSVIGAFILLGALGFSQLIGSTAASITN